MLDDITQPKRKSPQSGNSKFLPNLASPELENPIHDPGSNENNNEAFSNLNNSEQQSTKHLLPDAKDSKFFKKLLSSPKKILIASIVIILVLLVGGAAAYWYHNKTKPKPISVPKIVVAPKIEAPKPIIYHSPLTGAIVTEAQTKRPVTAIMIENSPDARPQSALRDAGVVFEAIAEGGITRFLTLFQESTPSYIGPVRSVRPYYLDWFAPFQASVAHVGGSKDALDQVRSGMRDLDQFFNSSTYWRITSRYAPHNVYTSFEKLDALNLAKGYTSSVFTSWQRKEDKPIAVPTAKTIDVNISGFYYNSHYDYDLVSNSYLRSEAGKPHVDITSATDKSPEQLHPKTVIVMVMSYSYGPADDGYRSTYGTTGTGQAWVFQDGDVTLATWTKADRNSQLSFKNTAGQEIALNRGQTWLSAISDVTQISYKP